MIKLREKSRSTKLKTVDKALKDLDTKIQRLSFQVGHDLAKLEEKQLTHWEYVGVILELLQEQRPDLTDQVLFDRRKKLVEKWRDDKLTEIKAKLVYPQVICEECFSLHSDESSDLKECPKCRSIKLFKSSRKEGVDEDRT